MENYDEMLDLVSVLMEDPKIESENALKTLEESYVSESDTIKYFTSDHKKQVCKILEEHGNKGAITFKGDTKYPDYEIIAAHVRLADAIKARDYKEIGTQLRFAQQVISNELLNDVVEAIKDLDYHDRVAYADFPALLKMFGIVYNVECHDDFQSAEDNYTHTLQESAGGNSLAGLTKAPAFDGEDF